MKTLRPFYCEALAFCLFTFAPALFAQQIVTQNQLQETGYLHAPLPLDDSRSLEYRGLRKRVISAISLSQEGMKGWSHWGIGDLSLSSRSVSGHESIRLSCPNINKEWKNSDHAVYGSSVANYSVGGKDWRNYNRLFFSIYPDCPGTNNVSFSLYFRNDGKQKVPDEYGREGMHEINLKNHQWNRCYLEIAEIPRDYVTQISFGITAFGKDLLMGDHQQFDIGGMELQQVADAEVESGWMPASGRIVFSTTGYNREGEKTAIVNIPGDDKVFRIFDKQNKEIYSGKVQLRNTSLGAFRVADFSDLKQAGEYYIKVGGTSTASFVIADNIWTNSVWKALNFIFCERCGYPVAQKHAFCHADIYAEHNGLRLPYNGGWHDAGDLSQQTLQTGDVMFALYEMANQMKGKDTILYQRLLEEAQWGLQLVLRSRFGDGYRASSAGMAIWTDGFIGNEDDTPARVHNNPFDNFLLSGMEAYAALSTSNDEEMRRKLTDIATQDFAFAMESDSLQGYGHFAIFWEHSFNTSKSQYMASASWAASILYQLTHKPLYAEKAVSFMDYVLKCQQVKPLGDKDKTNGFFYRDDSKKVITHFNHQSREQIYMQSLITLCWTQPEHPLKSQWDKAIKRYAGYLKNMMKYTQPYGLVPSGIYGVDEAEDSVSFNAQHLFPGKNARQDYVEQLHNGVKLDGRHYLRIFPVWFSFRGNTAVHLSMGKAAALCGNYLNDQELKNIAEEQLYWTVGKNPFGQSLMYGEGDNYPQQYAALPGEMMGEIPVGIQTRGNEDKPYWPQSNNATYKEVWVTSAGKWLSLVADLWK